MSELVKCEAPLPVEAGEEPRLCGEYCHGLPDPNDPSVLLNRCDKHRPEEP